MSKTSAKWLTGCGVGCAIVVVILICVGTIGYLAIKNQFQGFADAASIAEELEERFGDIESFQPEANGLISKERIEAFLFVRNQTSQIRGELEATMDHLGDEIAALDEETNPGWKILGLIKEGFGVLPGLGRFHAVRAQALLDAEMGIGEYSYIYVLAYYSWLGKSPSDGPNIHSGPGGKSNGDYLLWLNKKMLPILKNQLRALKEQQPDPRLESWRRSLETEIETLETNENRIPWQDGLPQPLANSLEPFRQELEMSYSESTNPLELGPSSEDDDSGWRDFSKNRKSERH